MDPSEEFFKNISQHRKFFGAAFVILLLIILIAGGTFVIPPGHRGVLVTMGKVSPVFAPEGLGFKLPFVTDVVPVSVRQQTVLSKADCYSSDLQQITVELRILYGIPEGQIVKIFKC